MSNYRKPPFFMTAEDNDEYDLTELEEDEVLRRIINLILEFVILFISISIRDHLSRNRVV